MQYETKNNNIKNKVLFYHSNVYLEKLIQQKGKIVLH